MIRRAGLTLAILSLVGLAVWAGAQAPAHQAIAQDLVIDPAAEAKADFSQLLNDRQPTADVLRATGPLAAQQYSETPFPRVTLYGGTNSSGWPLVGSWSTVTNSGALPLNQEAINDFSRFPMMILPATPLVDGRPDIVPALRAANPNNKIFGYAMGHTTWCSGDVSGNNSYPANYYYRHYWLAATLGDPQCNTQTGGLLWMQDGVRADIAPHSLGTNVNLAYRVADGQGGYTYPVAEGLAQVMFEDIYQSGTLDGIFIDVFCSTINWMEDADSKFDYVRAGYNDGIPDNGNDNQKPAVAASFYAGWTAGHTVLGQRLRSLIDGAGGSTYPIAANCGQGPAALYPDFNGWMRENFPYQNGGSWFTNMYRRPGGYFFEDYEFRSPQLNYIFTGAEPSTQPYSTFNQRKMRFGLAAASLGHGWFAFEDAAAAPQIPPAPNVPYAKWWYDEYGVNQHGEATTATNQGWLGQPTSSVFQQFTAALNSDVVAPAPLDTVAAPWTFTTGGGSAATMSIDAPSPAAGSGSGKVHITQADGIEYTVRLSSPAFSMVANTEYAVTFWAKASAVRSITLALDKPAGGGYAAQYLPIGTTWQRYQVRLKPTTSVADAQVWVSLGEQTGDVWLDDIHLQVGMTSVFRRNFTRGTVLLNPSDAAITVPLERSYNKILGLVSPSLNDGSSVNSVTLQGTNSGGGNGDAIFLVDVDVTAPSLTTDLRAE